MKIKETIHAVKSTADKVVTETKAGVKAVANNEKLMDALDTTIDVVSKIIETKE